MARYAVLIRGVNVGGRQKLAMADLRAVLAGLGCTGARTLLQSGNAVFDADGTSAAQLEQDIAAGIAGLTGLSVRCLVRESSELDAVTEHDPAGLDPGRVMLGDRVIYHWCPAGYSQAPPVAAYTEKKLRVAVTARNWNTVTKLAALASG